MILFCNQIARETIITMQRQIRQQELEMIYQLLNRVDNQVY